MRHKEKQLAADERLSIMIAVDSPMQKDKNQTERQTVNCVLPNLAFNFAMHENNEKRGISVLNSD